MTPSVFRTKSWRLAVCRAGLRRVDAEPPRGSSHLLLPETAVQFLSGHGPEDAVPWEFFCTAGREQPRVDDDPGARRAGSSRASAPTTTGTRSTPMRRPSATSRASTGTRSPCRPSWRERQVRIVFDGSMTDTTVWINGQQAGETHQGAFYRFHYDITPLAEVRRAEPARGDRREDVRRTAA